MQLKSKLIALSASVLCITFATLSAGYAQSNYPNRPIKVVVGFGAGSPSDTAARIVGAKMGDILGQQVVIENKPGASGMIAADMVARSAPDGYSLLNTPTAYAVNETLSKSAAKNMRIEIGNDFIAVAPQVQTVNALVVNPSLGVKTVAELVALAKSKPGTIMYGTSGRGSSSHLASELFNLAAGIKTTAVHYRGGADSVNDLLKGEIKMLFATIAPVRGLIQDGKLIALATTGLQRDPALPDLPTIAESGYAGFDARYWMGLSAPAGTPAAIVKTLDDANAKALQDPEVKAALAKLGFSPLPGSAATFDAFFRSEREKWTRVVRETKMDQE